MGSGSKGFPGQATTTSWKGTADHPPRPPNQHTKILLLHFSLSLSCCSTMGVRGKEPLTTHCEPHKYHPPALFIYIHPLTAAAVAAPRRRRAVREKREPLIDGLVNGHSELAEAIKKVRGTMRPPPAWKPTPRTVRNLIILWQALHERQLVATPHTYLRYSYR